MKAPRWHPRDGPWRRPPLLLSVPSPSAPRAIQPTDRVVRRQHVGAPSPGSAPPLPLPMAGGPSPDETARVVLPAEPGNPAREGLRMLRVAQLAQDPQNLRPRRERPSRGRLEPVDRVDELERVR